MKFALMRLELEVPPYAHVDSLKLNASEVSAHNPNRPRGAWGPHHLVFAIAKMSPPEADIEHK